MNDVIDINIRAVQQWHLLDDIKPMLNAMLNNIEKKIDKDMLAVDQKDPNYKNIAALAWMERQAVNKFRKELSNAIKSGKMAADRIKDEM